MTRNNLHICLVAGEASGDNLGGSLMAALREQYGPDVVFSGIGGPLMAAEGLTSLFPIEDLSVMGIAEVVPRIPLLLRRIEQTTAHIEKTQPDIVITIDSPDFSFRVAKKFHERVKNRPLMVHYVAPTVWAWRPERTQKVAVLYDAVLCLYPFEPPYFEAEGMKAAFIGHPVMENKLTKDIKKTQKEFGIIEKYKVIGVLFGSRLGELNRVGPVLHDALDELTRLLKKEGQTIHVMAPTLPHLETQVKNLLMGISAKKTIITDPAQKWPAFSVMDAAMAVSGTVGLELAVADVPHIIGYKMNSLTAMMIKKKLTVKYAHLANILLDKEVVPEFIQNDCQTAKMAVATAELLNSETTVARQRKAFESVRTQLVPAGGKGPSQTAAAFIGDLLTSGLSEIRKGAQ